MLVGGANVSVSPVIVMVGNCIVLASIRPAAGVSRAPGDSGRPSSVGGSTGCGYGDMSRMGSPRSAFVGVFLPNCVLGALVASVFGVLEPLPADAFPDELASFPRLDLRFMFPAID